MQGNGIYVIDTVVPAILATTAVLKINRHLQKNLQQIESEVICTDGGSKGFQNTHKTALPLQRRYEEDICSSFATILVFIANIVIPATSLRRFLLCWNGRTYLIRHTSSGINTQPLPFMEMPSWNALPWLLVGSSQSKNRCALLPLQPGNQPIPAKDMPELGLGGAIQLAKRIEESKKNVLAIVMPFGLPERRLHEIGNLFWLKRLSTLILPIAIVSFTWHIIVKSGWDETTIFPWLMAAMVLPLVTNLVNLDATHRLGEVVHRSGCSTAAMAVLQMIPVQILKSAVLSVLTLSLVFNHRFERLMEIAMPTWLVCSHSVLAFALFPLQIMSRFKSTISVWLTYSAFVLSAAATRPTSASMITAATAPFAATLIALILAFRQSHVNINVKEDLKHRTPLIRMKELLTAPLQTESMAFGSSIVAALILWGSKIVFFLLVANDSHDSKNTAKNLAALTIPLIILGTWNAAAIAPRSDRLWNSFVEAMGNASFPAFNQIKTAAKLWALKEIIHISACVILTCVTIYVLTSLTDTKTNAYHLKLSFASCLDTAAFLIAGYASRLAGWRPLGFIPIVNLVSSVIAGLALFENSGPISITELVTTDVAPTIMVSGASTQFVVAAIAYLVFAKDPEYFCFWRVAFSKRRNCRHPDKRT
jgi:hypothetical protein